MIKKLSSQKTWMSNLHNTNLYTYVIINYLPVIFKIIVYT